MGRAVGIDLGTTNSVVAVLEAGKPVVIPLAEGSTLCPSVVGFSKTGERLVGYLAKRQAITNPDRTISSIKRQMGTKSNVTIDGVDYTPEQISAMILEKLKNDAEGYLGEQVTEAVITVPAYFSNAQREATKDAGEIAGLEIVRIVNEPTAACLSYGQNREEGGIVLVWDLGGGTYDVSILEITGDIFEVLGTNGDTHLGGDDWDQRVMNWLIDEFVAANPGIDIRSDLIAMQRAKEAAEKAKIELSSVLTTNINLPFLSSSPAGPVHLETTLSRAKLEDLTSDLLDKMVGPTEQALRDANLKPTDIKRILLVGGSTRMPAVQALIRQMFNQDPFKGINPDEVVAQGAAIQAGIVSGDVRDLVLIDVTPLSLGIETQGGVFTRLIDRNTAIPTSHSQLFTTAIDEQSAVDIHVLQGERDFARDNKTLGKFQLTGIPPAPRGVPRIEVTFEIDVNGIGHVSAKDLTTDNVQKVTITSSSGLSRSDVTKMVEEAERYRQTDAKRREEQEVRNKAEQVVYTARKLIEDASGTVPPHILTGVTDAAAVLQTALNNFDLPGIQKGMTQVDAAVITLSQAKSQVKESPAPPPAPEVHEPTLLESLSQERGVSLEPSAPAGDAEAEPDEYPLETEGAASEDFSDV